MNSTQNKIRQAGKEVIELLIEKNKSYGDSALEPANIFARGNAVENLCARIDDKAYAYKDSRLQRLRRRQHKRLDWLSYFA